MIPKLVSLWNKIKRQLPFITSFTFVKFVKFCIILQFVLWIAYTFLLISRGDKIDYRLFSVASQQDFQKIGNRTEKLYAYSAHFDKQWFDKQSSITILGGLNSTNYNQSLYCRLYNGNGYQYGTVQTTLKRITGKLPHIPSTYIPFYIICDLSSQPSRIPAYVSLVETQNQTEKETNLLLVNNYASQKKTFEFSLCSQALLNYEDPIQLIEWIEFNRLMGVQKFTLYNTSIQAKSSCIIKSYGDLIETLSFTNPYTNKEMEHMGQLLSLNDCLQRNKRVSKYLVVADVEEMIIPVLPTGNNYTEMFQGLNKQFLEQKVSLNSIAAYRFRHGFFFESWSSNITQVIVSDVPNVEKLLKRMKLSTQIIRQKVLQQTSTESRAPYIVFPERCIELNIHNVKESVNNTKTVDVDEAIGYSHRYTKCNITDPAPMGDWCKSNDRVAENSAHRFVGQVAKNIVNHLNSKAKHCNIPI